MVEVKRAHLDWGEYRHTNSRERIKGESYVKIPSQDAKRLGIIRGMEYIAHFRNYGVTMRIKATGNGSLENGIQYAKQFQGIGAGACKAFTPWYQFNNTEEGDFVEVKFRSSTEVEFYIIKK